LLPWDNLVLPASVLFIYRKQTGGACAAGRAPGCGFQTIGRLVLSVS
jgi:hypothetical protein